MKLKCIFWFLAFLTGFFMTACSPPGSDTMRLSSWVSSPSETAIFQEILAIYQQTYPDKTFKYEPIPGNYSEKLQLMLGTKTAPDLFYLKGITAPSYMSFNILHPLDDWMDKTPTFNKDDFYPFTLSAFQYEGVQYGLPKDFNPYVLFYNKKIFKEAGIDSLPTNWEELEAVATQLTIDKNNDGKKDQFGFIVEPSIEMVMPFVFQNNGYFQNPDGSLGITDEPFIEALEFYHGLYTKGIATMAQDQGVSWNGDVFGRGICAMAISGGWLIPFLADNFPALEYGIIPLPAGKQQATVAFTTAYAIPRDSRYPADAWHMMDYLVGPTGMSEWTKSGIAMPTRKSVAQANGLADHPVFKVFMESAEFARPFQMTYSERAFEEVVIGFQSIFYADQSPRDAMNEIAEQIKKYKLVEK